MLSWSNEIFLSFIQTQMKPGITLFKSQIYYRSTDTLLIRETKSSQPQLNQNPPTFISFPNLVKCREILVMYWMLIQFFVI